MNSDFIYFFTICVVQRDRRTAPSQLTKKKLTTICLSFVLLSINRFNTVDSFSYDTCEM